MKWLNRLLARCDRAVSRFFGLTIYTYARKDGGYEEHYFGSFGKRFVIFREQRVFEIGGVFEICHRYDESGKLVHRCRLFKQNLQSDDTILFGDPPGPSLYGDSFIGSSPIGGFRM